MDALDRIRDDHAALRRQADALAALLGPQLGVGWDDTSCCDMTRFRAAQDELLETLTMHELREEAVFADRLPDDGREEMRKAIENAHSTLNGLVSLLRALSASVAEGRVHGLRVTVARVREELESHLAFEEKAVLPLLRRDPGARRGRIT